MIEDNMLFSHVKILCFPAKLTWYFIGGYRIYEKLMFLFNQNQINDLFVFAIIKASFKHSIHNGFKPRINGDILIWFFYFKDSLFSVRINALGCENTKMIQYSKKMSKIIILRLILSSRETEQKTKQFSLSFHLVTRIKNIYIYIYYLSQASPILLGNLVYV